MKTYKNLQLIGFLLFISGLFGFLLSLSSLNNSSFLSPVTLAMGTIFIIAGICGNKKNTATDIFT
ncbi:hypothetical protein [Methanobacterium sp.]|jgi:hypothetical protein|uniref:hypothetical protein n=1 Tax=Methanobacterium sp. TaxID=2164 RepID=UPI0031595CBB